MFYKGECFSRFVLFNRYYHGRSCSSGCIVCKEKESTPDTGLVVTVIPIQQQCGCNNCRLLSIAAAVNVANGEDVGSITVDESQMRPHLVSCFEQGRLSPFPTAAEKPPVKRASLSRVVIPVNCECRMPDSQEEMVACDKCM